jgi:His/Glu/Gln/Arg/opine family amino acid ABC transporter permease subunit
MDNNFDLFSRSFPLLIKGVQMTVGVLASAAALSFCLGLFLGIFSSRRLKLPVATPIIEGVTFVYRAVPFYVQLLIVYFVFPGLLGFNLEPFPASVIALGMCSSGYVAQIVRAGINAIPEAQWEAAFALSYGKFQTLRYIILPQMWRNVLPAFNNELDSLLKSTAIVSSIGLLELTRAGMNVVSREMEPIPIYLMVAFLYLCLSAVLNLMTRSLERRFAYVKN